MPGLTQVPRRVARPCGGGHGTKGSKQPRATRRRRLDSAASAASAAGSVPRTGSAEALHGIFAPARLGLCEIAMQPWRWAMALSARAVRRWAEVVRYEAANRRAEIADRDK